MSIQFVLSWTRFKLWMICDDDERKKEEGDKKEKRELVLLYYYLAGCFLQRRRFHRLFHSKQAFHFLTILLLLSVQ